MGSQLSRKRSEQQFGGFLNLNFQSRPVLCPPCRNALHPSHTNWLILGIRLRLLQRVRQYVGFAYDTQCIHIGRSVSPLLTLLQFQVHPVSLSINNHNKPTSKAQKQGPG